MTLLPGQCLPWIEGQNWLVDNHEDAICSSVALPLCVFASSLPLVWENELSANDVLLGSQTMLVSSGKVRFSRATSLGPSSGLGLVKDPSVFPSPASLGLPGTSWSAMMLSCTWEDVPPGMGREARTWIDAIDLDHLHGMAIPW